MPTASEVKQVAAKVVDALSSLGLTSCLCGGTACYLFGCTRVPNDVDILVLTAGYGQELIKQMIVSASPSTFFLRNSRRRGATHKILYARIGAATGYHPSGECKVDILVPGVLDIPAIPTPRIVHIDGLPVMPLIPLLLLKVQTWVHHGQAEEMRLRMKRPQDVQDVDELLALIIRRGATVAGASSWLPNSFMLRGRIHAEQYIRGSASRRTRDHWRRIGVEVSPASTNASAPQFYDDYI